MIQEGQYARALYLDMEWTCWDTRPPHGMKQEIIEIGVVSMDLNGLEISDEASYFVRPKRWDISLKCTQLTGITHDDIVKADVLRTVLERITDRFKPSKVPCYAWGDDVPILTKACTAHGIANPFGNAIDLAFAFQGTFAMREQMSLKRATEMLGIKFDGFAHGALPDAKNLALIHQAILTRVRSASDQPASQVNHATTPTTLSPFAEALKRSFKSAG